MSATRSLTVRLPADLYEHLQTLVQAGAGDMTKALIAVLRMHRDGTQGTAELSRLASTTGDLSSQVAGLSSVLDNLRDEVSLVHGSQGSKLSEMARTLAMLFEVLRDGEPLADEAVSAGGSSRQPTPSSGLDGTSELPVARLPGMRPVPTPSGTEYR